MRQAKVEVVVLGDEAEIMTLSLFLLRLIDGGGPSRL